MKLNHTTLAPVFAAFLALAVLPGADTPPAAKLRVLIVTGDDVPAHPWRETTPVMRETLETAGRFDVKVCEDASILASPSIQKNYDVVVLSYRDGDKRGPGPEAQKGLRDFVASGKGLVAVHFSICAFREWKEFRDLVGRVWVGGVSGHGPRGSFPVTITKKDHPITEGIADFETDDELYAKLEGSAAINVLATADSKDFSKQIEPMVWTLDIEKGRVCSIALGHDGRARKNASFQKLLARASEWAATGKVAK